MCVFFVSSRTWLNFLFIPFMFEVVSFKNEVCRDFVLTFLFSVGECGARF